MLLQQNFENSVSVLCLVAKFLTSLPAWEPKKMDVIFPQFVPALSSFLFLGEIEHRGLYFYHIVSFPHQLISSTLPFPFSLCPFCCQASFPASPSWPLSLYLSSFLSLLLLCCICFDTSSPPPEPFLSSLLICHFFLCLSGSSRNWAFFFLFLFFNNPWFLYTHTTPLFPPCLSPFFLTSFDVWRRVGIHSVDKERGSDVTADMIHQHLLWSKNTHHRAHTGSLQLHSAFVFTYTLCWDGPAFTQLGLVGTLGYMLLALNRTPKMCSDIKTPGWCGCWNEPCGGCKECQIVQSPYCWLIKSVALRYLRKCSRLFFWFHL